LTNVQAVAACTVCAVDVSTASASCAVNTGEERKLESDIQIVLAGLTTNTQSSRQQAGADGVGVVTARVTLRGVQEVIVRGVGVVSVDSTALKY